ncbi:DUF6665 family protein [Roseibium sp. FZY0029]|uniref:DUF6665 family protein n=1 Tax=Roseibium sp. FZY0029 TaxID=3116647 RepID=UPI002E9B2F78|nr:DUF6665 family protein [Roseibium sp. FZY0029]
MTLRPPQLISPADKDPLAAALENEVLNEKASTLSRLTKKLEKALADLKAVDEAPETDTEARENRLAEAGEALWHVTIQRELCGLRQHRAFYDFLAVPKAVRLRMGPASAFRSKPGS